MMLAPSDQAIADRYHQTLPHATLLVSEEGLDGQALSDWWAAATPSDISVIVPEEGKQQISIQQIRALTATMRTYVARRRVVIIRPAHAMTEEAQNALLKSLEEPLANTHFILETTRAGLLLPTIVSRCQFVQLHRTSPAQDASMLDAAALSEQERRQVQFLGSGRPALLRQLIADPEVRQQYQALATDAKQLLQATNYPALETVMRHSRDRHTALAFISMILTLVRAQAKARGMTPGLLALTEAATEAERALLANGHVRLTLLHMVSSANMV